MRYALLYKVCIAKEERQMTNPLRTTILEAIADERAECDRIDAELRAIAQEEADSPSYPRLVRLTDRRFDLTARRAMINRTIDRKADEVRAQWA